MDVVQLLPRLVFLRFPIGHVYLWRDADGLTLIDSGLPGAAQEIAEAVLKLGYELSDVRRLVLTHAHGDHVGGAADIASWGDVVVHAHRLDAPVVRGEAHNPPPVLLDWEERLREQVAENIPDTPPAAARVDREVEDGDVLDFGDGAQVLSVPGHTPGSIAVYLPESRVLFTGDTIARAPDGRVMLGVFNVDRAKAVASLCRQAELDVAVACFGHGEPLLPGDGGKLRAAADAATSSAS